MKSKDWSKKRETNRHHLRPRSRGGNNSPSNILRFDENRHEAWHLIFGNKTLDEVIELLQRLRYLKEAKRFRK